MKISFRSVLLLVGVPLIVSGPCALAHTNVSAEQALNLIDSTHDLIVVDVREPSEYCDTKGHIPGALNYPFISGVFQTRYGELPIDGPVLVVCGSGGRSNMAADFLDSEGFSMVYDMLGGMRAWTWETEPCVDPDSKYGGGTGEPNDPYLIDTAEQLNAIGAEPNDWDKNFKLMDDIDLSDYSYDRAVIAPDTNDVNDGFQGIPFTGIFDCNDHTISNLTIRGQSYLGLFGQLGSGAEISNLGLETVDVNGFEDYVGGLVGENYEGIITTCYITGTITGEYYVGGLVGYNIGSIIASYSTVMVIGEEYVGGLVGWNGLSLVTPPDAPGTILNCYSTGTVSGNILTGGLVGHHDAGDISGSFWDIQTSGQAESSGGTGKTTAEMQTAGTFLEAGWDFMDETENGTEDIWNICEGTNYPRFVWQITAGDFVCPDGITIDDFAFFLEFWLDNNCDLSNDYCQGTDLDQSGTVDVNDLEILLENWSAER